MIAIKLDGKLSTAAGDSLGRYARELYGRPGMALVGVVELRHVERTQPAPDEDKEPAVKLRITGLEIATPAMVGASTEQWQAAMADEFEALTQLWARTIEQRRAEQ